MFTFEVYAGKNFLGYEYAADCQEAKDKTYRKFDEPYRYADCSDFTLKLIKHRAAYCVSLDLMNNRLK